MNKHSDPLDYLIQCCESAIETGNWNLNRFAVSNAKDELSRLRKTKSDLGKEASQANQNSMEDTERWLGCERELCKLKEKIKTIFNKPVAYGLINDKFDLYNLTLHNNPYDEQANVIPLYSNKTELIEWVNDSKSKKQNFQGLLQKYWK